MILLDTRCPRCNENLYGPDGCEVRHVKRVTKAELTCKHCKLEVKVVRDTTDLGDEAYYDFAKKEDADKFDAEIEA